MVFLLPQLIVLLLIKGLLQRFCLVHALFDLVAHLLTFLKQEVRELELIDLVDEVLTLPEVHLRRRGYAPDSGGLLHLHLRDILQTKLLVLSEDEQTKLALGV